MRIEKLSIPSRCLGREISTCAAVPEQPSGQWALLLHGYSQNEEEWLDRSSVAELADRWGLTLILPGCGDGYYEDTQEPLGCFLGEELPAFVRGHFPVSARREDTFIAGASMGGFGALLIGSRYSRVYGKIAALAGAFIVHDVCIGNPLIVGNADIRYFRRVFGDFFTLEDSPRDPLYHVRRAVAAGNMPPVYMLCGTEDIRHWWCNERMYRDLTKLGVEAELIPVPGIHSWSAWNPHLEKMLNWLLSAAG